MTTTEFITQFDIYYNNIASNIAPSVNNYEKSVFLTQAELDIIIELYNGRGITGLSFESTEEARVYLRELTKSKTFTENFDNIDINSDNFKDKILFITYEECKYDSEDKCLKDVKPTVVPIKQDEIANVIDNPFRGASRHRVLRVDMNGKIKLISKYKLKEYTINYIKRPEPIILEDLSQYDVTIDGESKITECELNPVLHRAILERAVLLAKTAYTK